MAPTPEDDRPPSERIHDTDRILQALRKAARETLLDHKRTGDPVVVWRDGRVVWVPAEEIPVEEDMDS